MDIDIELSIVELKGDSSVDEVLIAALDALPLSGRDQEAYAIGSIAR